MTTTSFGAPGRHGFRTGPTDGPTTTIRLDDLCTTSINFLHVDEADQAAVVELTCRAALLMQGAPGNISANVLRSLDGSRVMTYCQWISREAQFAVEEGAGIAELMGRVRPVLETEAVARVYRVVYADDRSVDAVSVISADYAGAIFVNEITTRPETQDRLLELVIANNEAQSQSTPGYRSANFHQSLDGHRAVNYSLWDTQEHCIEAISAMADMDANLEETVQIAEPDFRFYTLVHSTHA